jgi:hypothetical protein
MTLGMKITNPMKMTKTPLMSRIIIMGTKKARRKKRTGVAKPCPASLIVRDEGPAKQKTPEKGRIWMQ